MSFKSLKRKKARSGVAGANQVTLLPGVPKIQEIAPGQTNMLEVKEMLSQHLRAKHPNLGDITRGDYLSIPPVDFAVEDEMPPPGILNAAETSEFKLILLLARMKQHREDVSERESDIAVVFVKVESLLTRGSLETLKILPAFPAIKEQKQARELWLLIEGSLSTGVLLLV